MSDMCQSLLVLRSCDSFAALLLSVVELANDDVAFRSLADMLRLLLDLVRKEGEACSTFYGFHWKDIQIEARLSY
jgi:hypothetical protein